MSDLDHPNILRVYGYSGAPSPDSQTIDVSLVSPFYPNGNLNEFIKNDNPVSELVKSKIVSLTFLALPVK